MSHSHLKSLIPRPLTLSLVFCAIIAQGTAKADPERIVTIGGAATEIVFALGAGDSVVAVDSSSTHPHEVTALPIVGYIRNLSPEGVLSMKPDLIIATGAVGPPGARRILERVEVPAVWLPDPLELGDVYESIDRVAEALGREATGEALKAEIAAQLEGVATFDPRPSVLFLLEAPGGPAGGMAGGRNSRADTLIRLAGGTNAAQAFHGFKPVSQESLLSMNPDVILIGRSTAHGGSTATAERILGDRKLAGVEAVRREAVYTVPLDNLSFGPRFGAVVLSWNERLKANHRGGEAK